MRSLWIIAAAAISIAATPLLSRAQAVSAGVGWAHPLGRLAEFQDGGPLVRAAFDRAVTTGWSLGGSITHADFEPDDRQTGLLDAPWLPIGLDLWSLAAHAVGTTDGEHASIAVVLGLGADLLRSTRLYTFPPDPDRLREVYPAAEAGVRIGWRPLPRIELLGEVRGHVMMADPDDTEVLFAAGGARDDVGRWLSYFPMMVGLRLRL